MSNTATAGSGTANTGTATLTTKELSGIEDQLGMEQTLVKKCQAMSDLCTDAKLQKCLLNAADKHQKHVTKLMSFLG
jgi:hypothetical protein